MKQKDFEDKMKQAAKEFSEKKKSPTTPAKQFEKGALWAWELLMEAHEYIYYEEIFRNELIDREGEVKKWKESLIIDTAKMKARQDRIDRTIEEEGDLLEKHDKNGFPYYESNPLHVHLKELDRSIGMQREHLGLTNKANPERMKESPRQGVDVEKDGLKSVLNSARDTMNEVPEL